MLDEARVHINRKNSWFDMYSKNKARIQVKFKFYVEI